MPKLTIIKGAASMDIDVTRKGKLIGILNNNWRQRRVYIYEDVTDESMVITYGESTVLKDNTVVTREPREFFKRTIDKYPKEDVFN